MENHINTRESFQRKEKKRKIKKEEDMWNEEQK